MGTCRGLQTGPVESVHAGEYVEFLTEQGLQAFLTFVGGVDFDTSILDHPELVFELFGIG